MDKNWHPEHFQCVGCSVQFSGSLTYRESGEAIMSDDDQTLVTSHYSGGSAFCDQCYAERILPKCFGCHRPITDRALKALDAQWHVECFVCEVIVRSGLFLNLLRGCHRGQILHLSPPSKYVPCTDASNDPPDTFCPSYLTILYLETE